VTTSQPPTHDAPPAETLSHPSTAGSPPAAAPLSPADRYRTVRLHARGGLGEVHVAEDAELHRPVALKRILPDQADDPDSRRRFLREAEITARLQHPAIVPVYGLAADEHGQPGYAMRFIEGESLDEAIGRFHAGSRFAHADKFQSLPIRQLLAHFVAVCQAVAYAHSKGIIHRDLKPANIMLGPFGETYLVDWGVARILDSLEAETAGSAPDAAGDRTEIGSVVGTPAYMSPEQAAGRWDLVGPAADVYSLGAVLYCVLTGRPPINVDSWVDVQERIEQGDFPPPRRLDPAVPRPLDAVCRKALAVDPAGRYASALDLAADVNRWLADEPVTAEPEPRQDRLRRWVKRHRSLTAGLAATVVVGLLGAAVGLAVVSGLNRKLDTALHTAEGERDRALAARNYTREALDAMLSEKSLAWLEGQKELTAKQRAFLQQALAYYEKFAAEPGEDDLARRRLADASFRVASLQSRLGQFEAAEATTRRTRDLVERLAANDPSNVECRRDLGRIHDNLAHLLAKRGRHPEAEAEYRAALVIWERLEADYPADPMYHREVAGTYNNMAVVLDELGRTDDAEAAFRKTLGVREEMARASPDKLLYRQELARAQMNLGAFLADRGRRDKADAAYRSALQVQERLVADEPGNTEHRRDLARTLLNHGGLLDDLGRPADAEVAYRRSLAEREKLVADAPLVAAYRQELARAYLNLGELLAADQASHGWAARPAEAEAALRASLALREKLVADAPDNVEYRQELADTFASLGDCLTGVDKRPEAEAAFRRALAEREKLAAKSPTIPGYRVDVARSCTSLGTLFADGPDPAAGLPWYDRAVDGLAAVVKQRPKEASIREALGRAHAGRARALTRLKRFADADRDWDQALALTHPPDRPLLVLERATELAKAGAADRAADIAAALGADPAAKPNTLYNAACVCAGGGSIYAEAAVALLRQAAARGFRDMTPLLTDPDLNPLRGRADFADLLWDLAD
jgi:serine/threonine-protein kinase